MYFDLHVHLLPQVDDGAADLDEAVEMVRALAASGYAGAALTPHLRTDLFPNRPETLRRKAEELARVVASVEPEFELVPGAEHYLDERIFDLIVKGEGVPLGGKGSVYLIEVPMEGPVPWLEDRIFRLRLKGITPLLAHPERCAVFRDVDLARRLVDSGAHLQLDLGSIGGAFGRAASSLASELLAAGLYSVAGTDLHDAATAREDLGGWLRALDEIAGSSARASLLAENPRRLIEGRPLAPFSRQG